MGVQGLGREVLALLQDELVEIGQDGRVEADVVFDDENHLHTRLHVMLQIHAVFHQLDDGDEQVGVAQPTEDGLEDAQIDVLHTRRDAVAEGREHDDGHGGMVALERRGDVEHVVVGRRGLGRHTDDEVDAARLHDAVGLVLRIGLKETRREAQAQLGILLEDFFVDTAVVFQHERVIRIGHNQHIADAPLHQVNELSVMKLELHFSVGLSFKSTKVASFWQKCKFWARFMDIGHNPKFPHE